MNLHLVALGFLDELEKIAITRSVQEWRSAAGAGNQGQADQIARASGQLGLKPRYLENISEGGMEAGVDKMMGRAGFNQQPATPPALQQRLDTFKANKAQVAQMPAASATSKAVQVGPQSPQARNALLQGTQAPRQATGPNQSGYIAQKVYKPDSPVAVGGGMTELLQTKQHMTDTARSISPEAKSMVPAMYGHKTIEGGGQIRHVSQHEFVPGLQSLHQDPNASSHVHDMQRQVAGPMAAKGMPMRDIPRLHAEDGHVGIGGNASNMGVSPSGPKVIDFLPEATMHDKGYALVRQHGPHDLVSSTMGSGRMDTGYGEHNLNQLRRDVYKPSAGYQQPSLSVAPPVGSNLPTAPISGVRASTPAPVSAMAKTMPVAAPTSVISRTRPAALAQVAPMAAATAKTTLAPAVGQVAKTLATGAPKAVGNVARVATPGLRRLAMGAIH